MLKKKKDFDEDEDLLVELTAPELKHMLWVLSIFHKEIKAAAIKELELLGTVSRLSDSLRTTERIQGKIVDWLAK